MNPIRFGAFMLVAGLSVASATAPAPAQAPAPAPQDQSMGDLRQQIERLKQEMQEQAAELEAARARIKELEQQLADSDDAERARSGQSAPPPATPADPALGPGGLLATCRADYLASFPTLPSGSGPDAERARRQHIESLTAWVNKANRDGVRNLTWTGRIDPGTVRRFGRKVNFTIVFEDPNGTRDYRVPVTVSEGAFARVVRNGTVEPGQVSVNARVSTRMAVNQSRATPGAFDVPPSVGPFVEFGYDVQVTSIAPVAAPKPADAPAPAAAP
jgi:hypothetical protein